MATANFANQRNFRLFVKEDDYMDELEAEFFNEEFQIYANPRNEQLDYYTVEARSGHYGGIQLYVSTRDEERMEFMEIENSDELDDVRKEEQFINETVLPDIAEAFGFFEIRLVAQASNGEAFYEKVEKNPEKG